MDTLSLMLQATRSRSPLIADLRLGSDLSVGVPSLGGIALHYVASGACRLETEDGTVELNEGDFVMVPRLPRYRFRTGDGVERLEIMDYAERDRFSPDTMRAGADHLLKREVGRAPTQARIFSAIVMPGERPEAAPLTRDLPRLLLLRDTEAVLEPWFRAAIEFMSPGVREPEPGSGAMAERLIELTFIAALRRWLLDTRPERGWMRGLTDPAVSRVLNAVHAQPGRRWTLSELAIVGGRSRSSLAQHFRELMDETPFAYITRWRMHLAAAALAQGDRSTAKIAASLGYEAPQAFSRAFVAVFGVTPARYRRDQRPDRLDQSGSAATGEATPRHKADGRRAS